MLDYDPDEVRDAAGRVLHGPHKHLRVLERRFTYLQKRITKGKEEGKLLSYDVLESEALEWALNAIYQYVDLPEEE